MLDRLLKPRALCRLTASLVVVTALCAQPGRADLSHIKHKIRLKKLAKLAFAAKLLAPKIIPLPIPLPIIKHQKHQRVKVIELDDDQWKGGGWSFGGSWPGGGSHGGWEMGASSGGWSTGGQMGWEQGGFGGWNQEEMVSVHGGGHFGGDNFGGGNFGGRGHKVSIKELQDSGGPWMGGGGFSSGGGHSGHSSHQIEIREEVMPALKAAGFSEGPNGELVKMASSENSGGWRPPQGMDWPSGGQIFSNHRQQMWPASMRESSNFGPPQHAEILEAKEVGHAKIIEAPFDVENAKLGNFDVSSVPVQAMHAPPVKHVTQVDPWPSNVAASRESGESFSRNFHQNSNGHGGREDSHLQATAGHFHSNGQHVHALRNHLQSEASHSHGGRSFEEHTGPRHGPSGHQAQESYSNAAFADEQEHHGPEDSQIRVGIVHGVHQADLKPLKTLTAPPESKADAPMDGWRPLAVSSERKSKSASRISADEKETDGKQVNADKWIDAHRRSSR